MCNLIVERVYTRRHNVSEEAQSLRLSGESSTLFAAKSASLRVAHFFAGSFIGEGVDRVATCSANCRICGTRQRANDGDQNGPEDPIRSDFNL